MLKKYLSFTFIVIVILLMNTVYAQSNSNSPIFIPAPKIIPNQVFSDLNNITPSYSLIVIPKMVSVNRGDKIEIRVYVAGLGAIKNNKLQVFAPRELSNSGIVGTIIVCATNINTNITAPEFYETNTTVFDQAISFSPCNFMHANITYEGYTAPVIISERNFIFREKTYSPMYIIINTARNAVPGDHIIELVFTYTDGTKWYQDKEMISVHVNNPVEENRTYLLIILALFSVPWVTDYTKEKFSILLSSRYGFAIKLIRVCLLIYVFYLAYNSI